MSTKTHTIHSTEAGLRNRGQKGQNAAQSDQSSNNASTPRSADELLIEKLDVFLSSIEHRLESFDQYLKVSKEEVLRSKSSLPESIDSSGHSENSRSRSASITSIKEFSLHNLNRVYEQLGVVKDMVLKTSVSNLDYLYETLNEKYNYLFDHDGEISELPGHEMHTHGLHKESPTSREILADKIITNLTYFEQKLAHIDTIIKSNTPSATANYNEDAKFRRFRFFNFNRAIAEAQTRYLHYYQLPLSWRENRYIIYGYRFDLSHREMWKSIFHFNHNEAANIWTHVLGAALMCYLGFVHFPASSAYAHNTTMGNTVMFVFIAAALECLVSSVLWHTYSTFAQLKIRNRFACVDYTGITVLITCSVIAVGYCALYNYAKLLYSFMAVSVLAGIGGFLFNWSPWFDRPDCRPLRIVFFVSLAFLGATTFFLKWYYEGLMTSIYFYSPLVYKSFVWYWFGVVFYGGLIPERWRYDVIINEDDTCGHEHSASEVLMGNVEHSGEEELREVAATMQHNCGMHGPHQGLPVHRERAGHVQSSAEFSDSSTTNSSGHAHKVASEKTGGDSEGVTASNACSCVPVALDDDTMQQNDILRKHFPDAPVRTPYHRDFLSLWWVDYVFQSHNIWHVFVVLGVVGHYFSLLGMYEQVHLQQVGL